MIINDALHRLLLDNLTTATLLLNDDLRLEYMNPAAEMLLAVSGQRSHGQFISELFTESSEALSALRQAVQQAHPFNKREAVLTSISGQTLTVDYAVTPVLSRGQTHLLLEVHPRDRLLRISRRRWIHCRARDRRYRRNIQGHTISRGRQHRDIRKILQRVPSPSF